MGSQKRTVKKSPLSRHEEKAGVTEQELIEAFERVVREHYPNPERIGCPGEKALRQLATSARIDLKPVLDHVVKCAPCLMEYDRLRKTMKARPRR